MYRLSNQRTDLKSCSCKETEHITRAAFFANIYIYIYSHTIFFYVKLSVVGIIKQTRNWFLSKNKIIDSIAGLLNKKFN